jgi:hypothetical protein
MDLLISSILNNKIMGRPRSRWEANIRMDLKEIGINMRNWSDLAKGRDYWRVLMNVTSILWVS